MGAIPHFEFTRREYEWNPLNFAMDLAYRYDRLVDGCTAMKSTTKRPGAGDAGGKGL